MNTLAITLNILYIVSNAESMHPLIEAQKDLGQFEVLMRRDLGRSCGWSCCGSGTNEDVCRTNYDCNSGWCEGTSCMTWCSWSHCACKAKRDDGKASYEGYAESCSSGEEICGTCVGPSTKWKLRNKKTCSRNVDCISDWCEDAGTLMGCYGTCRPRRVAGVPMFEGDSNSCKSRRGVCGMCASRSGRVMNGAACSAHDECESDYCQGCPTTSFCSGICTAKSATHELAPFCIIGARDDEGCVSGEANRCVCTASGDNYVAPFGTVCDATADCAMPAFCQFPEGEEHSAAYAAWDCKGTCDSCPAELGCGYFSCHLDWWEDKATYKCGRKTFIAQFGEAAYGLAESLIGILNCFTPDFEEGFFTAKSCALDAANSAAQCMKPGTDCSIVIGKPIGEGGCLELAHTWENSTSEEQTFEHSTKYVDMSATLGFEAEYKASVTANALAGIYFDDKPRIEAVITPPVLDVSGKLRLYAKGEATFKADDWTDRRYELGDSETLMSQVFMVGAVPIMVHVEAVPVAYVTVWGSTKGSAEFVYEIKGNFTFADDLALTFSLDDGTYKVSEWTPTLMTSIEDSWSAKLEGSLECGIRVVTGVDLTVMISGVSMRITPAVVGELGLSAAFEVDASGTVYGGPTGEVEPTGELNTTMKIGSDMNVQFAITPFTAETEVEGELSSARRHLQPGGKFYQLQQMALEYQNDPVGFMKAIAAAEESGIGTSIGEFEYQVGDSINIFDAMQFQCEKFAEAVECDAVGSLCGAVIGILKKFGWDGEIDVPDLGWDTRFTSPMKEYALETIDIYMNAMIEIGSATEEDKKEIAAASEEEIASWNLRERYSVAELRPYEVAKDSEEEVASVYELYEAQVGAEADVQNLHWEDAAQFYNEYAMQQAAKEAEDDDDDGDDAAFEYMTALEQLRANSEVKSYLEQNSEEKAEAYLDEETYGQQTDTMQSEGDSVLNVPMMYGLALIGLIAILYFGYTTMCSGDSLNQKYNDVSQTANEAEI